MNVYSYSQIFAVTASATATAATFLAIDGYERGTGKGFYFYKYRKEDDTTGYEDAFDLPWKQFLGRKRRKV